MQMKPLFCASVCASALVGCGNVNDPGGFSTVTTAPTPAPSPAPAPSATAEGMWVGSTNTNRAILAFVLDDGDYYILYSRQNDPSVISGVVQGRGTSANGSFSSISASDLDFVGAAVIPSTVSASYIPRVSLNGSVIHTPTSGGATFTSTYRTTYEATPTLAALEGSFSGQVDTVHGGTEGASLSISSTGAISGRGGSGCALSGSASPRSQGNVFNITLGFGPAPCRLANESFTGMAYYDTATRALTAVATSSGRTEGVLFVGTKTVTQTTQATPRD